MQLLWASWKGIFKCTKKRRKAAHQTESALSLSGAWHNSVPFRNESSSGMIVQPAGFRGCSALHKSDQDCKLTRAPWAAPATGRGHRMCCHPQLVLGVRNISWLNDLPLMRSNAQMRWGSWSSKHSTNGFHLAAEWLDVWFVLLGGRVKEPHQNAGAPTTAFKPFEPHLEALETEV